MEDEFLELEGNVDELLDSMIAACKGGELDSEKFVPLRVVETCSRLLKERKSVTKVAALLAELAKNEDLRIPVCKSGAIFHLVSFLNPESNVDTLTNCLRSIANLCFDCDESRSAVLREKGHVSLCKTFFHFLHQFNVDLEKKDDLMRIFAGTILNLSNDNDEVAMALCEAGALSHVVEALNCCQSESSQLTLLDALGSLTETKDAKDALLKCDKLSVFQTFMTKILASAQSASKELQLKASEKLYDLADEDDDWKRKIGEKMELVSGLARVVEEHKDEDVRSRTGQLLSLLLTQDECMSRLFDGGKGMLVERAIVWLKSDDARLEKCAAMMMGNFSRKDDNCLILSEMDIPQKLICLAKRKPGDKGVQFAALSALRNLSLPATLKPKLILWGLVELVCSQLEMSDGEGGSYLAVHFKALAILRLLLSPSEKKAALLILNNSTVRRRIVELSGCSIHAGVQAESSRLIAALVKICGRGDDETNVVEVLRRFVDEEKGSTPAIVFLINSSHPVMINEGLIALSLLVALAGPRGVWESDCEFKPVVERAIQIAGDCEIVSQIRKNALTFLDAFRESAIDETTFESLRTDIEKTTTSSSK